jgi:flagellar capping protein FliD
MVGLKTDTQTGEFRIDDDMFRKAIDTDLDNVIKMFTTTGLSDNRSLTLEDRQRIQLQVTTF